MSPGLIRKLLIISVGVLLVLVGTLYQLRQNKTSTPAQKTDTPDRTAVLTNSLQLQRRHFQRCWLRRNVAPNQDSETSTDLTWQIFLKIEPNGKVTDFALLNKALFDAETEKCLREISYRLKFPSFEGEEISLSVPIVISNISENH